MKHNIDLNQHQGSYSNLITTHIQDIYSDYENKSITLDTFKQNILEYTKECNETPAFINFKKTVNQKKSKDELVLFISNVQLRAMHLSANINDKWSNEQK